MQQVADTHLGAESNVFSFSISFFSCHLLAKTLRDRLFKGEVILIRNIENMQVLGSNQGFILCGVNYSGLARCEHNFVRIGKKSSQ